VVLMIPERNFLELLSLSAFILQNNFKGASPAGKHLVITARPVHTCRGVATKGA